MTAVTLEPNYEHHHPDHPSEAVAGTTSKNTRKLPKFGDRQCFGGSGGQKLGNREVLGYLGRSGRTWTCDPCVPNVVPHRETPIKSMDFGSLAHHYRRLFTGFRWSIGGWNSLLLEECL